MGIHPRTYRWNRWTAPAIGLPLLVSCANPLMPSGSPEVNPTQPVASQQIVRPVPGGLTPEQQDQLLALDSKIIVPTYLPIGFQVTQFQAYRKKTNQAGDASYYDIFYQGPNNQCLRLYWGNQGFRYQPPQQTSTKTKFGQVRVDYGEVGTDRRFFLIQSGFYQDYALTSGGLIPQQQTTAKPEYCQAIPLKEYLQVLQGLEDLQAEQARNSAQPQQTTETLVSGLTPLPASVCRRTRFYQIRPSKGSSLLVDGKAEDRTVSGGTIVLLTSGNPLTDPKVSVQLADQFEGTVPSANLTQLTSGRPFRGKMKIKTLEGGSVNVRSQPTTSGQTETSIVGTIANGTTVTVLGSKGDWYYTIGPKDLRGFVLSSFLVCP